MIKSLSWGVVVLLLIAAGIFGIRSWFDVDDSEVSASPSASTSTPPPADLPSPSPSASASPEPSPSDSPEPEETEEPETDREAEADSEPARPATVSTAAATRSITSRLNAIGPNVSVWCPPQVPAAVGTRFTCSVAEAARPDTVIADAAVTVVAPSGIFRWRSIPR